METLFQILKDNLRVVVLADETKNLIVTWSPGGLESWRHDVREEQDRWLLWERHTPEVVPLSFDEARLAAQGWLNSRIEREGIH